jgi:hypothetical protein
VTRHEIGDGLVTFGIVILLGFVIIQNQMLIIVAKLSPLKTNRPFRGLFQTLRVSHVWKEYCRLSPARAKGKLLLAKIALILGCVCVVVGIYLS